MVLATLLVVVATPAVTAAADPTYTAWTWGGNGLGQLGNGTTTARRTPGAVPGLTDIVQIAGGRDHVVALDAGGRVWTWGGNAFGQLGIGNTSTRLSPTMVPGLTGIVEVASGHDHSLARTASGSVYTWGLNTTGQIGDGSVTNRLSPVAVTGLTDAVSLAAGRDMSYAIRANGWAYGWGQNSNGELGDGTTTRRTSPVRVGTLTNVEKLAGGRDHGLARLADGSLWAWGWNAYGQVGDGTLTNRTTPVQLFASGIADVIAGAHHSYALRTDGQVLSWGRNYRNELGDGTSTNRTRPVSVTGVASAVSIASGRDHGLAAMADGSVRTWGYNADGQLGDGTTTSRPTAITVPGISGVTVAGGGGQAYSVVLVPNGGTPPANQDPVAAFSFSCTLLACTFDASASDDPDGDVTGYAWTFGDGDTAGGPNPAHTYTAPGSYPVTLTVTDDEGATDALTRTVTVTSAPSGGTVAYRAATGVDANVIRPAVTVPAAVQPGDTLLLFVSANRGATATTPAGWTLASTKTDGTDMVSWLFTRTAVAGTAGSSVTTTFDAITKASLVVMAYSGAGPVTAAAFEDTATKTTHPTAAATVPASGSTVVSYWVQKVSATATWSVPGTVTARTTTTGSGGGFLVAAAADTGGVAAGPWPAVTATSTVASARAIGWSVVLPPV
ncbi:RCC1 domain-containing protein [Catellatospora vulcania]|uniref:RCC1 domain-containing protein n=1 Tax=Catellatospora vulcania TaxID=1460450 RepID=UPI0018AFFF68|nr:PKD domain-containing protein [Catellatospora vulcania]